VAYDGSIDIVVFPVIIIITFTSEISVEVYYYHDMILWEHACTVQYYYNISQLAV